MAIKEPVVSAPVTREDSGEVTSKRILELIENNQFTLLYQLIESLEPGSNHARHYEVFIRLIEEEENLMPPGEFFPLAEKYGLIPSLDRWVVKHVLGWVAGPNVDDILDEGTIFFVNLSGATIRDPEFPGYLQKILQDMEMPGARLCFEIQGSEIADSLEDAARFAYAVRDMGCKVAICGFGRGKVTFDMIRGFQVDFLKIDGSIIISMLRDLSSMSKTTAINQIAAKTGIKTIAEFVEDEETLAKLKNIGISFAQGFGIAKPCAFNVKL